MIYTWTYVQIASFGHICFFVTPQVPTFAAWMLRVDVLGNAMADVIYILAAMVINPTVQDRRRKVASVGGWSWLGGTLGYCILGKQTFQPH